MKHLDNYDIALGLNELERFFWNFCDNYIEIVKRRLYNPDIFGVDGQKSGQMACYLVLLGMLKMFSIFLPHITEEIYQAYYAEKEQKASIHISSYLNLGDDINKELLEKGELLTQIVSDIRSFKSENKISLKTMISSLEITLPEQDLEFVKATEPDLKGVGGIVNISYKTGDYNLKFGEIVLENN